MGGSVNSSNTKVKWYKNAVIMPIIYMIIAGVITGLVLKSIDNIHLKSVITSNVNNSNYTKSINNSDRQEVLLYYLTANKMPEVWLTPIKEVLKPGEEITINAQDSDGINHIGYAWDSDTTRAVYNATETKIYTPTTAGKHYLHIYAKDNLSNYVYTGWLDYEFTITNDQ